MKDDEKRYSVFVGGTEVNDFMMTLDSASNLANEYLIDGYNEIWIRMWSDAELEEEGNGGD